MLLETLIISLIQIHFYHIATAQKMKFSIKDFFQKMQPNPQFPADLVTFTEEIFHGNFIFCAVCNLHRYGKIHAQTGIS